jgi:hypothetical protein
MICSGCLSHNQVEMNTEINIHYSSLRYPGDPGILVFPTAIICLDCGVSQFTVDDDDLAQIAAHSRKPKARSA